MIEVYKIMSGKYDPEISNIKNIKNKKTVTPEDIYLYIQIIQSMCFLRYGFQPGFAYSRWGLTKLTYSILNVFKSRYSNVRLITPIIELALFVHLYINDLPDAMEFASEPYLYADDTKIFKEIYKTSDCEDIQKNMHAW
jgi:hypothetical protein